ncbi:glycosyltransferase family 4 protein [Iningainema tapete]|uniref:Glycosyltransferase family 4 protein n=1 Tax=Iningainema tapete BLCC-T55 TaxID=2748662 RepID=A0A8J7C7K1_9CYAN|nr:glycosyltransferase family 4 protein [Iningainema tapete]MBD2773266.1 glycosyltransferase family 4 protein [Iningainema tapete BLCC-T55]
MKILLLHNYYQISGGEDVVVHTEKHLLEANGHEVVLLAVNNDNIINPLEKAKAAVNAIYSLSSKNLVSEKIASFQPDLVHIHNFFPLLSPSVYYACREANVPVVQTLHNYRLFCANSYLFRSGKVCEDCLGKFFPLHGVIHGCYRDSKTGTAVVATMQVVHQVLQTWEKMIDQYITLTEFARQKFIQGNLPSSKIAVKPNFIYPNPGVGNGQGKYALFVGRLSPEKGIETLLKAWEKLGKQIPLKIVGDGPLADQVVEAVKRLDQVEWLGRKSMLEVYALMGEAMFLVFPSQWYETFGLVAVEAFSKGTPVVAANIGAIAELVDSGRTGLYFHPGDAEDLTAQVEWILANPAKLAQMRREARAEFEAKYTAQKNYQMLMEIYERARSRKR